MVASSTIKFFLGLDSTNFTIEDSLRMVLGFLRDIRVVQGAN